VFLEDGVKPHCLTDIHENECLRKLPLLRGRDGRWLLRSISSDPKQNGTHRKERRIFAIFLGISIDGELVIRTQCQPSLPGAQRLQRLLFQDRSLPIPVFGVLSSPSREGFPKTQQATQSSVSDYHSSPTTPDSTPEAHIARFLDRAIMEEKDNKAKAKLKEQCTLTANDWEQLNDVHIPIEALIRIISMAPSNFKIQKCKTDALTVR